MTRTTGHFGSGAAAVAVLAIAACGSGEATGDAPVSSATPAYDRGPSAGPGDLCAAYRDAVANVRVTAAAADRADDLRAVASAARSAAEGTEPADLSSGGAGYIAYLRVSARRYDDAATALDTGDTAAYEKLLDFVRPAEDQIHDMARMGGLEACAVEPGRADEQEVAQPGFPVIRIPRVSVPVPPDAESVSYRVSPDESLILQLVPGRLESGTVPLEQAAEAFETHFDEQFPDADSIERAGASGNRLVPMVAYRYTAGEEPGTADVHVFSGQGRVWSLWCATHGDEAPGAGLERACDRAVQTLGFRVS